VAACALPVAVFGCGTATPPSADPPPHAAVGSSDPAWVTHRPNLPPPDTDRINYDIATRTLALYDLPGNDRWLVQLPGEGIGRPVSPVYRLPADVELTEVRVYYSRPGVKPSASVTVQQILDSGNAHSSHLALR
jgi:hypothetical protein